ncbi:MAG: RecQ family zinc-binding domain-containing protein, partial [Paramuribaculum sp.]|nr:RecQ family zinc-binding domain-containing protein [Paramuribaculum sp.]
LFCERFKLQPGPTRSAMAILTRAGYWEYVDEVSTRSRAMVIMDKRALYDLPLDENTDRVFQTMLRTYTGLFADYVNIDEGLLCRRTNLDADTIYESLLSLARLHAIHYIPKKTTPYIYMSTSRELPKHIALPKTVYEDQRERMKRRIEAMKRLVYSDDVCRMDVMLSYFGETPVAPCGCCDNCRARKRRPADMQQLREAILHVLALPHPLDYVAEQLRLPHSAIIPVVRQMADEQLISISGTTLSRVCNSTAK